MLYATRKGKEVYTTNTRIKKLRKALDLTQREFADRVGMKPNTIATYEIGRATPSDPTINNICKEFRVNEPWLRTGEGEMFLPPPRDALDEIIEQSNLPREFRAVIDKFLDLKPNQQEAVIEYMHKVAAALAEDSAADERPMQDQHADWEAEADEFAAIAREQFLSEKRRESQAWSAKESGNPGGGKPA